MADLVAKRAITPCNLKGNRRGSGSNNGGVVKSRFKNVGGLAFKSSSDGASPALNVASVLSSLKTGSHKLSKQGDPSSKVADNVSQLDLIAEDDITVVDSVKDQDGLNDVHEEDLCSCEGMCVCDNFGSVPAEGGRLEIGNIRLEQCYVGQKGALVNGIWCNDPHHSKTQGQEISNKERVLAHRGKIAVNNEGILNSGAEDDTHADVGSDPGSTIVPDTPPPFS